MASSLEDISQLKVKDIRKRLAKHGVDTTGTKALLISRLTECLRKELEEKPTTDVKTVPEMSEEKPEVNENEEEELDDGEIKPKHTPIVYNIPQKDSAQYKAEEEEKKKRRAERFGPVTVASSETKRMKTKNDKITQKLPDTEKAKMEMRAKRFGTSSPNGEKATETATKDSIGLIDLSHIVSGSSVTEDEKKKRRAERFGPISK
eukprot:g1098.t1